MALKYKIHDLAKLFGCQSKELVELIKGRSVNGKKYSTMILLPLPAAILKMEFTP